MDINLSTQEQPIITVKGFDQNLRCRGYQFEVGKTYTHEGTVEACKSGFHAVEYALDVFGYYPPSDSRYCVVAQSGQIGRHADDTKIVSASITIQAEITLPQLIQRGVDWIMSHLESNTGKQSAATNTGYRSAATNTGNWSAATNTGYRSAATNTGNWSAATNTGTQSAATNTGTQSAATNTGKQSAATNTGYRSAATNTGNWSAATNTGNRSAATNTGTQSAATNTGTQSAATNTGDWSAATNTGTQSAATNTGTQSAATNTGKQSAASVEGPHSVALSAGLLGRAKASEGSAIVLVDRGEDGVIRHIRCAIAGQEVKADTWYILNDLGEFEEVENV